MKETFFNPDELLSYDPIEENNFWFSSRIKLIIWAMQNFFPNAEHFFELGCGTGFILSKIQTSFPKLKLIGSDLSPTALKLSRSKINGSFIQMDARAIPFRNQFDLIGSFDVLEHIEEDALILQQIHQALTPNGGVILTVPHHPFLWSQHDIKLNHIRRYTKSEIINKLNSAGFKVLRSTAFISLLFPCMLISRLLNNSSELQLSNWLNNFFKKILNLEYLLIQNGLNFPIGGSLLIIAQKIQTTGNQYDKK